MATNHYSNIGKDGIIKEGIFVRFPDFEPASKDNYWNSNKHRKLLIVAESSYFEDEAESVYKSVFKDPVAWYTGEDTQHLIPIPETEPKKYNILNILSEAQLIEVEKFRKDEEQQYEEFGEQWLYRVLAFGQKLYTSQKLYTKLCSNARTAFLQMVK